jgi:hypothetical protein
MSSGDFLHLFNDRVQNPPEDANPPHMFGVRDAPEFHVSLHQSPSSSWGKSSRSKFMGGMAKMK